MRDAVIIGAGVTGIYMAHRLLEQGKDITVLEAGEDLGGTWYWNRYPGARFDSESFSYGYSFDRDIVEEWNWSEHFAGQPETLRYLNFVAEKLGVRRVMQFNATVKSAHFDEVQSCWHVEMEDGRRESARFLLCALGVLSAATLPRIEGRDTFEGEAFHTYYWPKDREVELAGKRVAVIGTGATGVQTISEVANLAGSLTVFQRRPNWCAPLRNSPVTDELQAQHKASYDDMLAKMDATFGSFVHDLNPKSFHEVSKDEREEYWNWLYEQPGFGVWLSNYAEVYLDPEVNKVYSEFIASKIRERVKDPETAEKLIPKDHGFGIQRVPLETRYYEAYNLPTTRLVDAAATPIECITSKGIKTSEEEFEFDLIIYATGFDSFTGSYDRIDIQGTDGAKLKDKWEEGPITYLGVQVANFPNMFMLAGPQSASAAANFPPSIQAVVEWTTALITHMDSQNLTYIGTEPDAEAEWTQSIKDGYEGSLLAGARSWFTGYNSNVDGHDKIRHMMFLGGAPAYRERLGDVAAKGYEGFELK